ncbi:MAG: helix-turn-helix domain-containing protein [Planctomycetota bacterium]|nr:MAG: helix-turn-helix domain-containing protein [Planctomycetota bacterium]
MSRDFYTLDELVQTLGRDRRQVEKLINRGIIPGRRIGGEWRFNEIEVTHWLEQDLRGLDDQGLAQLEQSQQSSELNELSPIEALLQVETCEVPLDAGTRPAVLQALLEVAGRTWHVWDPASVLKAVKEREDVMSTAFENGVAIPHPRNPLPEALGQSVIAFGRTLSGIPFGAPRRQLTDLFFLVLARDAATHLQILARLGRILNRSGFVDQLRNTETARAAYDLLLEADRQVGS